MKPALLVLAAGMGSRYGGLKQMDGFGPGGETLMDYSIYDAKQAGFETVVFVTRKDILDDFKKIVVKKYEGIMEVRLAMQELDMIPEGFNVPAGRVKPWGTAHAVLVARSQLDGPFAVINADDFYGAHSYQLLYSHLAGSNNDECCVIGYLADETLSEHGYVSRAVLNVDDNGYIRDLAERKLRSLEGKLHGQVTEESDEVIPGKVYVSMNQMGFVGSIFDTLSNNFSDFMRQFGQEEKSEIFLPTFLNDIIDSGQYRVKMYPTTSSWFGVTYQNDKPWVKQKLLELIRRGDYPEKLW